MVFLLMTLIGLALNTGAFRLLLIPLEEYGRLGRNAAALATVPISVAWNFTAYRRWTFKLLRAQSRRRRRISPSVRAMTFAVAPPGVPAMRGWCGTATSAVR